MSHPGALLGSRACNKVTIIIDREHVHVCTDQSGESQLHHPVLIKVETIIIHHREPPPEEAVEAVAEAVAEEAAEVRLEEVQECQR